MDKIPNMNSNKIALVNAMKAINSILRHVHFIYQGEKDDDTKAYIELLKSTRENLNTLRGELVTNEDKSKIPPRPFTIEITEHDPNNPKQN